MTRVNAEAEIAKDIISGLTQRIPRQTIGIDNGVLVPFWAHNHVRWKSMQTKSTRDFVVPGLIYAAYEKMFAKKMRPTIADKSPGFRHIRYILNELLKPYGTPSVTLTGEQVLEWIWPDASVFPATHWNTPELAAYTPEPLATIRIRSERQAERNKNMTSIRTFLGSIIRSPATSPWNAAAGKPYANAISSDLVQPLQFFLRVSVTIASAIELKLTP